MKKKLSFRGLIPNIFTFFSLTLGITAIKFAIEFKWENAVASYLASVSFVDELIGDFIKALEVHGLMKNTWVVIWSDHGWHLGEKSHWGKATGWFRSTRVPFLTVPPQGQNKFQKSVNIHNTVNLLDLAPTLADMAGIPKKPEWEGRSLVPLLKGQQKENMIIILIL